MNLIDRRRHPASHFSPERSRTTDARTRLKAPQEPSWPGTALDGWPTEDTNEPQSAAHGKEPSMPCIPRRRRCVEPARLAVGLATVAVLLSGCETASTQPTAPGQAAAQPPQADGDSLPPWPVPADVAARVAAAGLDLGPMGTAEHYHPTLQILIDGQPVPVASNIGVDPQTGDMSALHTHDGDGTIHIEADRVGQVFTLGQLFTQWGVKLTATQIGGVRAAAGRRVIVTSNGVPVSGDPARLRLQPDQQIVLQLP